MTMKERDVAKHVAGPVGRRSVARMAAALAFGLAAPALASEAHGPHVHGAARLNVAVDGDSIWLEATLPAADVVGFEHAPESEADEAALAAAVETLKDAESLYRLPAEAGCRLAEASVVSELLEPETDHDHDHDKDHDADHAHGKDHEHGKDGEEADVHDHADFVATAIFRCAAPAKAVHVDVGLFEAFPTLHEVDAQAVAEAGQLAAELTPATPRFGLR